MRSVIGGRVERFSVHDLSAELREEFLLRHGIRVLVSAELAGEIGN
jgi:hypothetical protein